MIGIFKLCRFMVIESLHFHILPRLNWLIWHESYTRSAQDFQVRFTKFKRRLIDLEKLFRETLCCWPCMHVYRGHWWRHRSGQSQNAWRFGVSGFVANLYGRIKWKQVNRNVDRVWDTSKYDPILSVSIFKVKVIHGHGVKEKSNWECCVWEVLNYVIPKNNQIAWKTWTYINC